MEDDKQVAGEQNQGHAPSQAVIVLITAVFFFVLGRRGWR